MAARHAQPQTPTTTSRSVVADRAVADHTSKPVPTQRLIAATSVPPITPAAKASNSATGGATADSPLKNRLQALRDERFDEEVSGDLTTQATTPNAPAAATAKASPSPVDKTWRASTSPSVVQRPLVEKPISEKPVAEMASRYSSETPAANSANTAKSSVTTPNSASAVAETVTSPIAKSEQELAKGSIPAGDANRYANERPADNRYASDRPVPAAGSPARPTPIDTPPTYVARRDAIRPGLRDAVKTPAAAAAEAAKPTENEHTGPSALLASKSPVISVRTVGPRTITIGKPATYQLLLENSGDAAANEVLVTVKLPAWAEIASTQASAGAAKNPGTDGGDSLQWRVSRLDAGAKQQLTMQVVPKQSTPFQLAVQWTFVPEVAKTVVEVQEPKLQLALDGPKEMLYGANEIYRITLSNPGTGDAENVTVLTSSAATAQDGMNKLAVGTLPAGSTKTLELKIAASQAGTLRVVAKATADGNLASQAAADVLVRRAAIKLQAGGPESNYAGTQATYEVRVANPGNATAESVRVEATLPIGAKLEKCSTGGVPSADGAKVVWTLPSLAAGSQRAVELTCTLQGAGANRLQVAAAAQGQLADTTEVVTRVEALADLKLEVADPRGPVAVGADAVYEVRIRNRGTKSAEKVNVVGYFSDGVEPVSATGGEYKIETGQITFATIDALDPNEEVIFKITSRANHAGNHVFRAELVCESTETRLVVEETTKFYGDSAVKPAAHFEEIEPGQGGVEAEEVHDGGVEVAPPANDDGEPQPLSLLDE